MMRHGSGYNELLDATLASSNHHSLAYYLWYLLDSIGIQNGYHSFAGFEFWKVMSQPGIDLNSVDDSDRNKHRETPTT